MLQSASIRLNFWLLGTSQLDLHLLDCSIGMDAYCLMYYWFDLMSAHGLIWPYLLAQMCIILFAEVSAHIPSSSNPLNHMHQEKKKKKWNGQPWPIYLTCYLGPRSVVSWKFIEWDGWSEKCQLVQNYLVIVLLFESTFCDWRMMNWCMFSQDLRAHLDKGKKLPLPDGILINGWGSGAAFNVEQG